MNRDDIVTGEDVVTCLKADLALNIMYVKNWRKA
jgi:hypothetical protein